MRPATCFYWTARQCFATDAGGRRTILVKGPKTKANRELALQRMGELLAARPAELVAAPQSITVAELVDAFLANAMARVAAGELKPATVDSFYRPYGRLIKQECGEWLANRVDEAKVLGYRGELARKELSPTTVKNRLVTLRVVLRWAKRRGFIQHLTPFATGARRRREHIPTKVELDTLLAAARPDVRDVLVVLIHCPVRPGDCFVLRRGWVDVNEGLFRLPESKGGQRLVPVGDIPVVREILDRRLAAGAAENDFLFTTVRGRPWNFRYFGEQVRQARHRAGLGKHVIAYACRHYWTTTALLNGVKLETVCALRGDKDVRTTMIYEHISQHLSHLQQAARQAVGLAPEDGQ